MKSQATWYILNKAVKAEDIKSYNLYKLFQFRLQLEVVLNLKKRGHQTLKIIESIEQDYRLLYMQLLKAISRRCLERAECFQIGLIGS